MHLHLRGNLGVWRLVVSEQGSICCFLRKILQAQMMSVVIMLLEDMVHSIKQARRTQACSSAIMVIIKLNSSCLERVVRLNKSSQSAAPYLLVVYLLCEPDSVAYVRTL